MLREAKYAEKMQSNPAKGPDLMTYVWFGLQGGGLAATLGVGLVMEKYGPKVPFLISLVPCAVIVVPLMMNSIRFAIPP